MSDDAARKRAFGRAATVLLGPQGQKPVDEYHGCRLPTAEERKAGASLTIHSAFGDRGLVIVASTQAETTARAELKGKGLLILVVDPPLHDNGIPRAVLRVLIANKQT